MSVGFILLAHSHLHRAAQLVRWLDGQGAPVAVHLDRRVPRPAARAFRDAIENCRSVSLAPRQRSEWGGFGIVRATQRAAQQLLQRAPDLGHVVLLSGSCLPIRPLCELRGFLAANPETDFIESEDARAGKWVKDGLSLERFTLRFPFSWRRQRRLFDAWVSVQRRLGLHRRLPKGLAPHIGSQWWCLTRSTLAAVLADPQRPVLDRFFASGWISDETYFQSLARRHSGRLESRSLTLSRFDHQGKPHSYYDDHAGLLAQADHFFARKIWPGADGLYRRMLIEGPPARGHARCRSHLSQRPFAQAQRLRGEGRLGVLSPSRFPCRWHAPQAQSPGGYWVFDGFDALAPGWHRRIGGAPALVAHGRVFAPDRIELAADRAHWAGNIPASPAIRDRDPDQYLIALLRQSPTGAVCLQSDAEDNPRLRRFVAQDPHAQILRLADHALLRLARHAFGMSMEGTAALAARASGLCRTPDAMEGSARATLALADALADPQAALAGMLDRAFAGKAILRAGALRTPSGVWKVALALGRDDAMVLREAELDAAIRLAGSRRAYIMSA